MTDGPVRTEITKTKISKAKSGKAQTDSHKAAIRQGRKPKFDVGDLVTWFDEPGVVEKVLGHLFDDDHEHRSYWYLVRFSDKGRNLVQEVLERRGEVGSERQ